MPKLEHLRKGTVALQARLNNQNPSFTEAQITKTLTKDSTQVADRLEGAMSRLMNQSSEANNKTLTKELKNLVGLVLASHNANNEALIELGRLQVSVRNEIGKGITDLKKSRPAQKSDEHLVKMLGKLASDLKTLPRSIPQPSAVDLSPLTSLTNQVLSKVSTPIEFPTVEQPSREHEFVIERDPFTDLITKVTTKEI